MIKTILNLKFHQLVMLLFSISLLGTACDDEKNEEVEAGTQMAGEMTAGEMTAGEMTAGEMTAGEMTAGEMTAGEMTAGEITAGEMTAGEMTAGEMTAGEMTAGETTAGEMTFDGTYTPDATMSSLSAEGQQAFCEAFVTRNQEADAMTSESDRNSFKEKSCLLAGLFGGAMNEAACEVARQECLMDFDNAEFTVESCMNDFASAFSSCGATTSEVEACEVATRSSLLSSILALNTVIYSCSNVGEPSVFLLAAGLPTEPPAECAIPSVAMCQD